MHFSDVNLISVFLMTANAKSNILPRYVVSNETKTPVTHWAKVGVKE